jgi:hypothetical protein
MKPNRLDDKKDRADEQVLLYALLDASRLYLRAMEDSEGSLKATQKAGERVKELAILWAQMDSIVKPKSRSKK